LFFSEEKNQKTFCPALAAGLMLSPQGEAAGQKSLLLLFFRKGDSVLLVIVWCGGGGLQGSPPNGV
jgi:hypothetical protein